MRHDRKIEALKRIHGQEKAKTGLQMTDRDAYDKISFKRKDDFQHENQDLVLVRLKDFAEWPARVQKAEDFGLYTIPKTIFVTCFGTNELRFCPEYDVSPLTLKKRRSLEYRLNEQSMGSSYKHAIEEIIKLDKQKRASNLSEKPDNREKQGGGPSKRVRRLQDLPHVGGGEDAHKCDRTTEGSEELSNQESEEFDEPSLVEGKKMKNLEDVLNSGGRRSKDREFAADNGLKSEATE